MIRFLPWLAAFISGVLLTLCFPRWDQAWLCWVALTPLIAAVFLKADAVLKQSPDPDPEAKPPSRWKRIRRSNVFQCACVGYITGIFYFWGVFSWLITVTGLGWFALCLYLGLYPAIWAAFLSVIRRSAGDFTRSSTNLCVAAAGAAAWVMLEWVRGWLFSGFGWNNIGISLHANLPLIQITEYTGVAGLSFLIAFTNLIAVITVLRFKTELRQLGRVRIRPHWDFSFNMAMIGGVFTFGIHSLFAPTSGINLKIAAVQPNISEDNKHDPASEKQTLDRYSALTETALALSPQLLLWPEAATPKPLFGDEYTFNFVHDFAKRGDFNFLIGTIDFDEDNGGHDYNIAALLTQHGDSIQTYRKIHLVPYGEFIPFRHSFPLFGWIAGDLVPGDLTPGKDTTILRLTNPDIKAGALICFEDTLADLTRKFVQGGAQILINITNDAWFEKSAGSEQHLANAVFRTVENRRPLVRDANTGVTAFIDTRGHITHSLQAPDGSYFGEGILSGVVQVPPPNAPLTFYTQHGDVFSIACVIFSLLMLPYLGRYSHEMRHR